MTKYMWPVTNRTLLSGVGKALIVAAVFVVAGCGERLSREDFTTSVNQKSTKEVETRHGKPEAVDESAPGTVKWTYTSKTFNTGELTAKTDAKTVVVFATSDPAAPPKVVEVQYPQ